jgi:glycine/D-amino acid oxidase-like deaminating enzyme
MRRIGDHVVVLGASLAGLLAARVLADAYRRVTVVERDPLPETAENRKGVPRVDTPTCCSHKGHRSSTSSSRGCSTTSLLVAHL